VTSSFEKLQGVLRKLPGIGFRSSERIALHLLIGKPGQLQTLVAALEEAANSVRRCIRCGNLSESDLCDICSDPRRQQQKVCVVETVPDLVAIERSGSWRGCYHVLHGKLSPLGGIGPNDLNLTPLLQRAATGEVEEIILALPNDVEGEATCHYIMEHLQDGGKVSVTRIGFGIPSGGGVLYADAVTLKSALESRRVVTP
jgi:recombination protein RecR